MRAGSLRHLPDVVAPLEAGHVSGLPAIILGMALAVGCYVSVTTISWEWATVA